MKNDRVSLRVGPIRLRLATTDTNCRIRFQNWMKRMKTALNYWEAAWRILTEIFRLRSQSTEHV